MGGTDVISTRNAKRNIIENIDNGNDETMSMNAIETIINPIIEAIKAAIFVSFIS